MTYRNPALHAKITTTLDVISGGRAFHGIGAGWFEAEHDAYGFAFPPLKERFERLEDALQIARAMFTEEQATVEGTHHRSTGALQQPASPLRGDIPILIGGSGERKTLRMVAQYADGCNLFGDPERARTCSACSTATARRSGATRPRSPRRAMATVVIGATHEAAQRQARSRRAPPGCRAERLAAAMVGDPDTIAERAQAFADVGIEGMTIVMPRSYDPESVALAGRTLGPLFG